MKCPACGLFHPPQYERCVSCGVRLSGGGSEEKPARGSLSQSGRDKYSVAQQEDQESGTPVVTSVEEDSTPPPPKRPRKERKSKRRSKNMEQPLRSNAPSALGIGMFVIAGAAAAGVTFFLVTKTPDDQRLSDQGKKELANGQYAFAVKTFQKAINIRPKDPRLYLELARAYVGIDQVTKAHECISKAQQLGVGVVSEPSLATDLANHYRQRGQFGKAAELLRPLAKAGILGKKAELADLDAAWGDDLLRAGNVDEALRCWEEVRDLREGSRFSESDSRLATIYQKMANSLASSNKNKEALLYLSKLNNIAQNSKNFEMAADLYERSDQLELAIDQLRKAISLSRKNPLLERKLAALLDRRGKQLLDEGNADTGYAYLQQAKDLRPENAMPTVTLRRVKVLVARFPRISGEVWNPSDNPCSSLSLKVELFDAKDSRMIWSKEQKVVDEFVPVLNTRESKPFSIVTEMPMTGSGMNQFRVYLNGNLYKTYPIGQKSENTAQAERNTSTQGGADSGGMRQTRPAPETRPQPVAQPVTPIVPFSPTPPDVGGQHSAEEKTMKDLEP